MSLSLWLGFFAASWAISISPGPGAVAVMSASMRHGFARGYCATFGLVLGLWTQLLVVAVGLGAVLATSAFAGAAAPCPSRLRQLLHRPGRRPRDLQARA